MLNVDVYHLPKRLANPPPTWATEIVLPDTYTFYPC